MSFLNIHRYTVQVYYMTALRTKSLFNVNSRLTNEENTFNDHLAQGCNKGDSQSHAGTRPHDLWIMSPATATVVAKLAKR